MAKISNDITEAARLLSLDRLVGIPTETVYGLAGNALKPAVIDRIYEVKGRPKTKAFIVQTDRLEKLDGLILPPDAGMRSLMKAYWPGALTIVFQAGPKAPPNLIAQGETIGIRIPNHPITLELLSTIEFPVAVPSANISSQPSPKSADEVNEQIGDQIDMILDGGRCTLGFESTIVGFENDGPVFYREGVIPKNDILNVWGHFIHQKHKMKR